MAHFYLDNDLSPKLVAWLQGIGHDATHTRRVGRRYAPDDDQLVFAMRNGWPIVSHNREDYLLLHRAWHNFPSAWGRPPAPPHPGVFIIAQMSPPDAFAAADPRESGALPTNAWAGTRHRQSDGRPRVC